MASWFKHDIASWMDGTEGLDDGCYRAYHVICQLLYLHEGPILLNEAGIAGRCNQHVLKFRNNLLKLIELGKITLSGGRISNPRAETELKKFSKRTQTPRRPPANPPTTHPGSVEGLPSKPLKTNNTVLQTRLEKKREDSPLPPTGGKRRPRKIFIPPEFVLNAEVAQVAINKKLDAHEVFRQFRSWAENTGAQMLDVTPSGNSGWMGRWIRWCETEAERAKQRPAGRQRFGDDGLPRYD